MKHLTICDYGTFLGLSDDRLSVKQGGETRYYPLNRLCTISIAKRGVSVSGDLIAVLSLRGIKLFFLDFRGVPHASIMGQSQHAVVAVRLAQMQFCQGDTLPLAKHIVGGKIKNQRAVLSYFNKYHQQDVLTQSIAELQRNLTGVKSCSQISQLLGIEGSSANSYFQALKQGQLFSSTFATREKRGSREINNSLLNLGYSVLSNYILSAVINAGLEPYMGFLHVERPGRMALVLDLMEEYRAWVVDRAVIKLRQQSEGKKRLDNDLKKTIISEIQNTCAKKYLYRKKKIKLEHIIQRQIYRLCGHFYGKKNYKPYLFKW